VIESASGRVPEKAPRWDLTGIEGYDGGKVFWWTLLVIWEYLGIYSGLLGDLLALSPSYVGVFWSKKNHHESFIPFGLRLIFLFCKTQKQGKTETGTGL
jgi:hypothetical protein